MLSCYITPLPAQRETDGLVNYTVIDEQRYEQTIADKDRSGGQWAIWQALYSPVAADGFPAPLWDPKTGIIDPEVADHWRENWDLSHIVARDWAKIGPALTGKLHFAVGRVDNYYLEQAVYLMEERLRGLSDPEPKASFQYGVKGRHSWIGHSPNEPERQMTYAEFIDIVGEYIADKGPRRRQPRKLGVLSAAQRQRLEAISADNSPAGIPPAPADRAGHCSCRECWWQAPAGPHPADC